MVEIWYGLLEEYEGEFCCTTEAEDVAIRTISCEAIWLRKMFDGLFDDVLDSIVILYQYCQGPRFS